MDPELARLLSLGSLAFTALMLVVAFFGLRKERPLRLKRDLLSLAFSAVAIAAFAFLTDVVTRVEVIGVAAVIGLVVGLRRGLSLDVRIDQGRALARHGRSALITWGIGVLITQAAAATVRSGVLRLGQGLSVLGIASAIGFLLGRAMPVRRARKAVAQVAAGQVVAALLPLGLLLPSLVVAAALLSGSTAAPATAQDDPAFGFGETVWNGTFDFPSVLLFDEEARVLRRDLVNTLTFTVAPDGTVTGQVDADLDVVLEGPDTCSGCGDDHVDHFDVITLAGKVIGTIEGRLEQDPGRGVVARLQTTIARNGTEARMDPGPGHEDDEFSTAVLAAFPGVLGEILAPRDMVLGLAPGAYPVIAENELTGSVSRTLQLVEGERQAPPPVALPAPDAPTAQDDPDPEPTPERTFADTTDEDGELTDEAITAIDDGLNAILAGENWEAALENLDPQDAATAAIAAALAAMAATAAAVSGAAGAATAGAAGPDLFEGRGSAPAAPVIPPRPTMAPPGAAPARQTVRTWDPRREQFVDVSPQEASRLDQLERGRRRQSQGVKDQALLADIRADRARIETIEQLQEQDRQRIIDGARRMQEDQQLGGIQSAMIDQYVEDGNVEALHDLYRGDIESRMDASQLAALDALQDAAHARAAELVARAVEAAARSALAAGGGPVGMLGTGLIGAAGEGTTAYVDGKSPAEVAARTGLGYISGLKDAAMAKLGQAPGVSQVTNTVASVSVDTAEAYMRARADGATHEQAMAATAQAALASAAGEIVGKGADALPPGALRQVGETTGNMLVGAGGAYMSGNDPMDGALDAMADSMGGSAGSHGMQRTGRLGSGADILRNAIEERNGKPAAVIPLDQQGKPTQDLVASAKLGDPPPEIRFEAVTGPDGKVTIVETEVPATGGLTASGKREYGDPQHALEGYADTQSGRTSKNADLRTQRIIENTRNDLINKPANEATLRAVGRTLAADGTLRPGDRIEIDTFSTPTARDGDSDGGWGGPKMSKPDRPGADRDARAVILRDNPDVPGGVERIEIPREKWEKQGYRDWADRAMNIITDGGKRPVPADLRSAVADRRAELSWLSGPPDNWSPQDIEARAISEAHNQLLTDRAHMEASIDNSDQLSMHHVMGSATDDPTPAVVRAQQAGATPTGQAAMLGDPAGFARMWQEKTNFYADHNPPEALAQAAKGIAEYEKLRVGYEANGMQPPPLSTGMAGAMRAVLDAPTGVDATPEAMASTLGTIRSELGRPDISLKQALGLMGLQQEGLKWSKPAAPGTVLSSAAGTVPPRTGNPVMGSVIRGIADAANDEEGTS